MMEILIHEERRHKNQHGILPCSRKKDTQYEASSTVCRVHGLRKRQEDSRPGHVRMHCVHGCWQRHAFELCLLSSTINTPTHRSKSKSMLYFLAADFFLGAAFLAGDFFGAAFLAGDFLAAFGLE